MVLQNRSARGRFQSHSEWFNIDVTGPLFDGRATKALTESTEAMSQAVAVAGQRHIRTIGASQFRYEKAPPTHFFVNHVEVDQTSDGHIVHADQVIYGPWLEGTSSRNQTTRFKGYNLFRKAKQDIEARLREIMGPEFDRLIGQLNGRGL